MGSINKQISRFETTAVYTHPDAKVDVVLVHGLNGEPQRTWTAKNGVFWPTDLLPESLRTTRANILVYGYNADAYSKKHGVDPSDNFLYMHAQSLVTSLTHYRKDEQSSRNPIIWVCHSLGGLLVKRALLYSNDLRASQHEDYRQIYVSTFGLIFLGTPHTGSDMSAWGIMLQAMSDAVVPKAFWQSESVLLKTLKKDNETLLNINNHFLDIYQRFKILMAHENHKTDLKGTKMLVVDAQSASPQLPGVTYFAIEATHSGMCKFESKNAPGYRTVAVTIKEWAEEAPDVIATRWRVEEDEKMARAKHEIEERMKPWLKSQQVVHEGGHAQIQDPDNLNNSLQSLIRPSSKLGSASKPLLIEAAESEGEAEPPSQESTTETTGFVFVKPTVFKPNVIFKGREKEMKELHKTLMDKSIRVYGTSSVLIQSMPGGGKTHFARQYVFQHKLSYPGGIFWIRCKSLQELEYGYWDIGKAVAPDDMERLSESGRNDTDRVVRLVQRWLSTHEDWLLVLDGIHFDYPGLENFIPLNRNTSIIYTSTEKTTPEAYQFDNPQIMVLDSLSAREAQELLLEEMGKKKPWNADDLSRAMELVELMERLPVMIHVAALHLKATREPLSKYLRSFRNRPKAGNLPAYRAVREQLQSRGNIAALNLMSLLSFFSQHIPVEMLALGLKALDKRTPVKSQDPMTGKGTLNNTLKILIAFALVERNENEEMPSVSGQSSRSVDMAHDSLDILRIHGIVQAFFVDTLADEKQAAFWLDRAVCVFCRSFDESDRRIRDDPTTGLPEDYLRFSIHGKRLMGFLDRFERKHPELDLCRDALGARLDSIDHRIEHLTKRKHSGDQGAGEACVISVFERTNSLSEVDSATPPSNSSIDDWRMWDESTAPLESPAMYSPGDYNPYHWHVTYPYDIVAPGVPVVNAEDDMSGTVTPQPAPTDMMDAIPDEFYPPSPSHRTIRRQSLRRYHDRAGTWRASQQVLSDPRVSISRETVKGVISHTNTHGPPESRASSEHNKVGGSSDAESTLNKITKTNPPPPRGAELAEGADGAPGTDEAPESPTRPKLIAGRPSYTGLAHAEASPAGEQPVPTFSHVIGTYPPPSSRYAAATILRLRDGAGPVATTDGLAPVKVSSPLTAVPLSTASPHASPQTSQAAAPEDAVAPTLTARIQPASATPALSARSGPAPAGAPFRAPAAPGETNTPHPARSSPPAKGAATAETPSSTASPHRSARSSPAQAGGPYRPPPIPIEINTSSALRSSPASRPAAAVRRWDTYGLADPEYNAAVRPAGYEALARSLPSVRPYAPPNPPYPLAIPLHPNGRPAASLHPWTALSPDNPHPQGYSSQPMSRNASHQGGGPSSSTAAALSSLPPPPPLPPRLPPRPVSTTPTPTTPTTRRGTYYQLFTRSTSPSPSSSPVSFQRIRRASRSRSRRPSVVETEPSPRLDTAGFDTTPPTSYSLYPGAGAGGRRHTDGNPTTTSSPAEGPSGPRPRHPGSSSSSSNGEQRPRFWSRLSGGGSSSSSKRGRSSSIGIVNPNTPRPHHDAPASRRAESAGGRLVSGLGRSSYYRRGRRQDSPATAAATSPHLLPAAGASGGGGGGGGSNSNNSADATPRTTAAAAETMSPPVGSAGIRLADGTVVEFGATPPPGAGGGGSGGGLGLGIME